MKKTLTYRPTALLGLFGLLFLTGGWICLILFFSGAPSWMKYVVYGCFAVSFVFILIGLLVLLSRRKKDAAASAQAIMNLEAMKKGDLSPRLVPPSSAPVQDIALAIASLSEESFENKPQEDVLSKERFEEYLKNTLSLSPSVRSCLILIGLDSRGTPEEYEDLKEKVRAAYPSLAMGEIKGGFALFHQNALSEQEEAGKAKRFIEGYASINDPSSIKPVVAGAKAALVFYPDFRMEELWEVAYASFAEAKPIKVASNGEANLTPFTASEHSRKNEIPYEDYEMMMAKAGDAKDRKQALRLLLIKTALGLGYDQVGLALYDPSRLAYRLIEEIHVEGKVPAFKTLEEEGYIAEDRLNPYYDLALGQRLYCVQDALSLPSRPAAILDSLGLRSIAVSAIGTKENRIGIIYLTAGAPSGEIDYRKQFALKRLFLTLREHLLLEKTILDAEGSAKTESLLTENSGRYSYEIDPRTHRLLHLSANLAKAFPKARVGQYCFKALLGLNEPCPNCPLVNEEGFRKSLAPIGPGLLSFSALSKVPTATICLSKQERGLTPRRLDPKLYILNRRALMADLEGALLQEKEGIALLFRIDNAVMSAGKIKDGTVDDVMASVVSRLSISSLDEGLYRYDDDTLGYLLPDESKEGAFEVAKEVATALSNALPLQDASFVPELSYVIFAYPIEVSCVFDLESLTRTCMEKVPNLGKGRVIPFDDGEAPLVLPRAYKEDALKKAMAKGTFPLCYSLVRENSSLRPRYAEVGALISLARGEKTNPEELRALLPDERMVAKLEEGELSSFFASFKANAKAFKSSSLKGVILRIGKASLFSSTYMRVLGRGIKDAHIPAGYIHLVIPSAFKEEEREKLQNALQILKENKVNVLPIYGEGEKSDLALLKQDDLLHAFHSGLAEEELRARVKKAQEERVSLILPRVDEDEQKSYALALSIPYGEGKLYGEHLEEKDFLKEIA